MTSIQVLLFVIVVIHYSAYGWLSFKSNQHQDTHFYSYCLLALGLVGQYWIIMSRISKDILRDSIIYDLLILISYFSMLVFLGAIASFSWYQKIGFILVIAGLGLMHIKS